MMKTDTPIIDVSDLKLAYGRTDAVNGLNLKVAPGRCYGLFGRNGAGKTTTIKCLLNLLRPASGTVRLFGLDPGKNEIEVKRRIAYVPDQVSFYPWMNIHQWFDYLSSFRENWDEDLENSLLKRFELDPARKVTALSKGQKMQIALIGALCPEPELLILDEPTSGLDPLVRREFIRTVIGAYQEGDPENRTVFVSTHLITEFEGLIDEFTLMENGKDVLTLDSDTARQRYTRIRVRWQDQLRLPDNLAAIDVQTQGREAEITLNGNHDQVLDLLKQSRPEHLATEALSLEEIFLAGLKEHQGRMGAVDTATDRV